MPACRKRALAWEREKRQLRPLGALLFLAGDGSAAYSGENAEDKKIRVDKNIVHKRYIDSGKEIVLGKAMAKILLVDDDVRLSEVIDDWLTADEHVVEYQSTGLGGWEKMASVDYDVIILDWNLPDSTGPELCKRFRDSGKTTPVLLLTGRNQIASKVEGLDSGADDYLTKPFSPKELSARLRALLRRFMSKPAAAEVISAGTLTMDRKARTVTRAGEQLIHLLPREFALLEFFMLNPEHVFSANEIMDKVWSEENESSPDTVRVHITKLRSKLAVDGEESPIKTVHRVGYKFSTGLI